MISVKYTNLSSCTESVSIYNEQLGPGSKREAFDKKRIMTNRAMVGSTTFLQGSVNRDMLLRLKTKASIDEKIYH